jgi:hypothetical protein
MKDAFEIKGYWWLPDAEDHKLPGTLSFSQEDGALLEIVGVFGKERNARIEQPIIILGITQQGKPISLYKCSIRQWTPPLIGLGGEHYRAYIVFEGVHFESEERIVFNELYGHYTDLDAWLNIYGFTIDYEVGDDKYAATVRYEKPSSQFFDIGDGLEVGIGFSCQGPNQSRVQTEVNISQRAYLIVKSKTEDTSFDGLFDQLNTFSYLFQIAAQRVIYPVAVFGYSRENVQEKVGRDPYYPEINIYYQPIEAWVNQKSRMPYEMLFTFQDMDENQIKSWFGSFKKYETIIHLYRALFYRSRLFIETKFLNIAQSLETLHSILFGSQYLPDDEFADRKEMVLQAVPEELHEWVGTALSNANFKPFKLKIFELLNKKSDYFAGLIDDIDIFAKRVRDTRNEFIHQSKQKWTLQRGEELFSAINLLTMLFEINLLEIIGFSDEKIHELIKPKTKTLLTGWKHLRSVGK